MQVSLAWYLWRSCSRLALQTPCSSILVANEDELGASNTAVDSKKTSVVNVDVSKIGEVEHGTIDDASQKAVVNQIVNKLETPAPKK